MPKRRTSSEKQRIKRLYGEDDDEGPVEGTDAYFSELEGKLGISEENRSYGAPAKGRSLESSAAEAARESAAKTVAAKSRIHRSKRKLYDDKD